MAGETSAARPGRVVLHVRSDPEPSADAPAGPSGHAHSHRGGIPRAGPRPAAGSERHAGVRLHFPSPYSDGGTSASGSPTGGPDHDVSDLRFPGRAGIDAGGAPVTFTEWRTGNTSALETGGPFRGILRGVTPPRREPPRTRR